mmetsp:Transcript_18365/g.31961  ORF Transcript_18365/g.31961 Transcript_18365/m.31961 type:complete len:106 (+) Transcript_18365:1-318(+)
MNQGMQQPQQLSNDYPGAGVNAGSMQLSNDYPSGNDYMQSARNYPQTMDGGGMMPGYAAGGSDMGQMMPGYNVGSTASTEFMRGGGNYPAQSAGYTMNDNTQAMW